VSETLLAAAQLQVGRHERSSPAPLADLVRDGGRAASSVGAADEGGLAGRNITATNVMASADASAIARPCGARRRRRDQTRDRLRPDARRDGAAIEQFTAGKRGKIVISLAEESRALRPSP
jgi:hypothetical protein